MASYTLTRHAHQVIIERGIPEEWIQEVLLHPSRIESDKSDPQLCHALGLIEEYENRVLRVIYNATTEPWKIVTAYFDRKQKGKL